MLAACGSDSGSTETGKYSLSGNVSGLSGSLTLSINGTQETLTSNGDYTFDTQIVDGESYQVSLVESSDDLTCTIDNSSGTSNVNIINVDIECSGTEFTAYDLNGLAFGVEQPSVITFAFHLVDRETNVAVTGITTDNIKDYLYLSEDDSEISARESFLEVDQAQNLNVEFHTVFAIDVSASLSSTELATVIENIKGVIVDGNGQSKLAPNQYVSLYTFDSSVEAVAEKTQDTAELISALDDIVIGSPSTNLYGAIQAGVSAWENEITLQQVSYGSLILFTDGSDTSSLVSKDDALEAAENKDVYFIAVGQDADTSDLESFTTSNNIFELESFDELSQAVEDTFTRMQTFEDGLYILSYATPRRAGDHTLTIEAIDDYRCDTAISEYETTRLNSDGVVEGCDDAQSYEFNADDFSDVQPEILVLGPTITLATEVEWKIKLRWSNETPSYNWVIQECAGDTSNEISASRDAATFYRNADELGILKVQVSDDLTSSSKTSYLVLANNSRAYTSLSQTYIESACSHL